MKSILVGAIAVKNSTASKLKQVPEGYLLAGVDPHKKKHAVVIMSQDAVVKRKFKFSNSREGFEEVLQQAMVEVSKAGSRGVIFAIEAGSHYWRNLAYFLDRRGIPFRLINPFTLKRSREGEDINRRKNDFRDAEMAAELLRTGKFVNTRLSYGIYAEIRATYSTYRRLTEESTRYINLLKGLLDGVFPEFTNVFKDPCGKTALAVLSRCVVPGVIAGMQLSAFIELARGGFVGRALKIQKLRELHSRARMSSGIAEGAEAVSWEIALLAERIKLNAEQVEKVIKSLVVLVDSVSESHYLLSIVGLSYLTVAGILAGLGPLSGYTSAKQIIKMAGTNPTEKESAGKSSRHTPMSKQGRSGLRRCLWPAVVSLLRHNPDFRAWAKERQERPAQAHPLHRREVIGAAINRLLRLVFALVKKQSCYQMPRPEMAMVAI